MLVFKINFHQFHWGVVSGAPHAIILEVDLPVPHFTSTVLLDLEFLVDSLSFSSLNMSSFCCWSPWLSLLAQTSITNTIDWVGINNKLISS